MRMSLAVFGLLLLGLQATAQQAVAPRTIRSTRRYIRRRSRSHCERCELRPSILDWLRTSHGAVPFTDALPMWLTVSEFMRVIRVTR
jgi:hypothetical protein